VTAQAAQTLSRPDGINRSLDNDCQFYAVYLHPRLTKNICPLDMYMGAWEMRARSAEWTLM
jgi:hypothetical protein